MNNNSEVKAPTTPKLSFEKVTFSDGQTLTFDEEEIVVFVGPNNAGKSAALRDLQDNLAKPRSGPVVKKVELRKTGTHADLLEFLSKNAQKTKSGTSTVYSGIGFRINEEHVSFFDHSGNRGPVSSFFSSHLATENRITASNPAGPLALYRDPPQHPIHLLLMDDKLASKLSQLFRRAYKEDLCVLRAGGSQFPLYIGQRPQASRGGDELSKAFVDKLLASCSPLESQGDGMRSFASVMLYTLAGANHSVQFLDEPEAFLHPPQARLLGEYIAKERESQSQLFIATHSTDILDGLIAGSDVKVRIIRIQREGNINRIKELSKEKTASIANDTLTRFSGVFEGIFYKHVLIAESDSDCMFYSSILNTKSVVGDEQPDLLFIHAAGKHRMSKLVDTLRSLDVPVSVVTDVDILNEQNTFKNLYEKLGGDWENVSTHWNAVKTSVEKTRPPLNAEQVKSLVAIELEKVEGLGKFPKDTEREIKKVFKITSPWSSLKQSGKSALPGGQVSKHYEELEKKCSDQGLWIVPVGELEGFCRTIQASHGPSFVEKVLEERDLNTDSELEPARNFMAKIWQSISQ